MRLSKQILEAMRSGSSDILELTCDDKKTEKKVAVGQVKFLGRMSQKRYICWQTSGFFALSE